MDNQKTATPEAAFIPELPQLPSESRLVIVGLTIAIAFVAGFLLGARA